MEGKWVLTAFTYGDQDFLATMNEAAVEMGKETKVEEEMPYYEFFTDGTISVVDPKSNETLKTTYKLDGKNLSIDMDGNTMKAVVDGNSLSITDEIDGKKTIMVYTKK